MIAVGLVAGVVSVAGRHPASTAAPARPGLRAIDGWEESQETRLSKAHDLAAALLAAAVQADETAAIVDAIGKNIAIDDRDLRVSIVFHRSATVRDVRSLTLQHSDGSGVVVTPAPPAPGAAPGAPVTFKAEKLAADTKTELKIVRGQMDTDSFYSSAVAAGVNDALIPEFAQAFTFDFDFQREIHPGDVFEAAYEVAVNGRGEPVGPKRLLYVSLTTPTKSKALYRFTPPGEKEPGWFDGAGRTTRRGLMRTPVQGARISSSFGWRVHPISGFTKLHEGTDFAAPIGTPIYASGDGVVEWAAMKGPNGNLTILKHDNGWETYYLHQSRFADRIVAGVRVRQGQEIGFVGTTGFSTGPHLHYALKIGGVPVDPMAQAVDAGAALTRDRLSAFIAARDRIDRLRASPS